MPLVVVGFDFDFLSFSFWPFGLLEEPPMIGFLRTPEKQKKRKRTAACSAQKEGALSGCEPKLRPPYAAARCLQARRAHAFPAGACAEAARAVRRWRGANLNLTTRPDDSTRKSTKTGNPSRSPKLVSKARGFGGTLF